MSGGIFKTRLTYDATTPSDADSVAAFLRTGTAALTSTNVGGKEGLDVNIINDLTIDADGVYSGGNTDPDNVGIIGHVRNATPGDTHQTFRFTGGNPSADNVDPSTVHALDTSAFMHGWDGSAWDRVGISSGALNVAPLGNVADDAADAGNPVKVGSRAIDGALSAISAGNDRADMISDMYRRLWTTNAANAVGSNAAVSVDTTAGGVVLFATPVEGRCKALVQNLGSKDIFVGFGTVTPANGIRIDAQSNMPIDIGPDLILKGITATGSSDVRVMQLA
jgi:hypothetical protein